MIIADSAAGGIVLAVAIIAGYFLPTIVAKSRHVENANPTFIVNLFLGWTFIGWVVALAMGAGAKTRDGDGRRRVADVAPGRATVKQREYIYDDPTTSSRDHDRVRMGEVVDVLEHEGRFSRVRTHDGRVGWMKTDALASGAPTDAWTD